jgi:hypothetical protein
MINELPYVKGTVSKVELIDLEHDILMTLLFELQWASPTLFVERYLSVMNLQHYPQIEYLSF